MVILLQNDVTWLSFLEHGDIRGGLVSIEIGKNKTIPFDIKRIYYIFNTRDNVVRGKHAHKNLKQVVFAINGSCKMLLDSGTKKNIVDLNNPTKGLLIKNNIWREIYDFSEDCILLVLASEHFDESDYIRDYNEFLMYGF